jgi:hypothetical protein
MADRGALDEAAAVQQREAIADSGSLIGCPGTHRQLAHAMSREVLRVRVADDGDPRFTFHGQDGYPRRGRGRLPNGTAAGA